MIGGDGVGDFKPILQVDTLSRDFSDRKVYESFTIRFLPHPKVGTLQGIMKLEEVEVRSKSQSGFYSVFHL